jgi:hypothetical protein
MRKPMPYYVIERASINGVGQIFFGLKRCRATRSREPGHSEARAGGKNHALVAVQSGIREGAHEDPRS